MKELSVKKRIVFYLLMLFIVLVSVEVILQGLDFLKSRKKKTWEDRLAERSVYAEVPWAKEYFQEYKKLNIRLAPFYEWRKMGYRGKHINISPDGIRRTWNPDFSNKDLVKTVFCFGGSTLWGYGARDDFTIASLLSKKLNRKGARYRVINYGEPAYTSTQEVIYFILLLKEGKIPDYAIFFDGVNDIYAAYQNGKTGVVQNVGMNRKKLKMSLFELMREQVSEIINNDFLTYKTLKKMTTPAPKGGGIEGVVGSHYNKQELTVLAENIVADYQKNMEVVKSLAKSYGFRYFFVWQPMIFNTNSLTEEERSYHNWKDEKMVFLHQKVESIIKKKKYDHFYNFSSIFDHKQKTMYIDFAHLSEEGNEVPAEALYQILQRSGTNE